MPSSLFPLDASSNPHNNNHLSPVGQNCRSQNPLYYSHKECHVLYTYLKTEDEFSWYEPSNFLSCMTSYPCWPLWRAWKPYSFMYNTCLPLYAALFLKLKWNLVSLLSESHRLHVVLKLFVFYVLCSMFWNYLYYLFWNALSPLVWF